jgi:hypothetical protein
MEFQFIYDGRTFRLETDGFGLDRASDVAGMFPCTSNESIVAAQEEKQKLRNCGHDFCSLFYHWNGNGLLIYSTRAQAVP